MVKYLYPLLDLNFMKIYQTSFQISGFEEPISHAPLVIVDGNISEEAIKCVCDMCATHQIPGEYTTNWSNPPPDHFNLVWLGHRSLPIQFTCICSSWQSL